MRFYCITNMYLSSIQNGIQSFHVLHEMFRKYDSGAHWILSHEEELQNIRSRLMLNDWADNHKTMIVLNGGMTEHMEKDLEIVKKSGLPFSTFYEPGIGNALTCIGIVVPEKMYNATDLLMSSTRFHLSLNLGHSEFTQEEYDFIVMLKSKPLAK